jgi:hypothetical protein
MKLTYFEYSVAKLIEWYCAINQKTLSEFKLANDFSKLKVLKLHFFLCAVNSNSNSLLNLFDAFYAMPYGHVEGEIYGKITANELEKFKFTDSMLGTNYESIKDLLASFQKIEGEKYKNEIDEAIESLKSENIDLINYSALELVDLSHLWTSWKVTFNLARSRGKFSERIPSNVVQNESKFYSIAD